MCRADPWQAFEPSLIVYFLEFPISALILLCGWQATATQTTDAKVCFTLLKEF